MCFRGEPLNFSVNWHFHSTVVVCSDQIASERCKVQNCSYVFEDEPLVMYQERLVTCLFIQFDLDKESCLEVICCNGEKSSQLITNTQRKSLLLMFLMMI